jgi:hypothetical protein
VEPSPWPSRAVLAAAAVVVTLALWSDLSRFADPVGDKFVFYMRPGAADFIAPYQGARTLLAGLDPYRDETEALRDPWHRETVVDGRRTSQFYPPTHLLLLTPLALVYGDDFRAAGRVWLLVHLGALVGLALVTARLARRAAGLSTTNAPALALFCLVALALHGGALLGLERGQADAVIALLGWGAIALWLDDKPGRAAFWATAAMLLKGYALLLPLGIVAGACRDRRQLGRALAGMALALLLLLAPVVRWLPDWLGNMRARLGVFHAAWYNVSFRSLTEATTPSLARPLAWLLVLFALVAALLAWLAARRANRLRDDRDRALWLALFAGSALAAPLSAPAVTYSYALVNVLPAALVVALAQDALVRRLDLGRRGRIEVPLTILVMLALFYALRLPDSENFPLAPLGTIALASLTALAAARSRR